MKGLITTNEVSYSDLGKIVVPESTQRYQAVPYTDLVTQLANIGEDMLRGFELKKTKYGLARDNQQMFGIHTYKNSSNDIGLSVGFRTSYNKTLSNAIAIGGNVFVCENLMIQGDIMVMRKHTTNVYRDLETLLGKAFDNANDDYEKLHITKDRYFSTYISKDKGYQMLGMLYGNKVLRQRQLNKAMKEWDNPTHKEHGKNSAWTLYNACTEALKTSPFDSILERHKILDAKFEEIYPVS